MFQLLYNKTFNFNKNHTNSKLMIDHYIKNDQTDNFILILPTSRLVNKTRKYIIKKYWDIHEKPLHAPKVMRLNDFIRYCFDRIYPDNNYKIISNAYRLSLFEEASENAGLKFFKTDERKLSIHVLKKLENIIIGIKEDGFLPSDLEKDINNSGFDVNKKDGKITDFRRLTDIKNLFSAYQDTLTDDIFDEPELLNKLNNVFSNNKYQSLYDLLKIWEDSPADLINDNDRIFDRIFSEKNIEIMVEGFSNFKEPEILFLSHFNNAPVPLSINIDYSDINGPLFGTLKQAKKRLGSVGFNLKSFEDENYHKPNYNELEKEVILPNSLFLRRWLFNTEKDIRNSNFSDIISIIKADSRNDEINQIANLVKYLVKNNGIALHDICLAVENPDIYSAIIRERFESNNIPVNISDRYYLQNSPVTIAIFSVLDLMYFGFRKNDLQKVLLNPYLSFEGDFDKINLFNIAQKLRLRSDRSGNMLKYWEIKFKTETEKYRQYISFKEKDPTSDQDEIAKYKVHLINIEKAREDFKTVVSNIPQVNDLLSPNEFKVLINELIIRKFNLNNNILKEVEVLRANKEKLDHVEYINLTESIEKDAKALNEIIKIIDEMTYVLNTRFPERIYRFDHLYELFKVAVSGARYQIQEKLNYGLTVTSIEQTRGIPFKVMILCGALDNEFPQSYQPEKFIGKELYKSEDNHIREERTRFYQFLVNNPELLNSNSTKIYIFYPAFQDDEELVRSPFIDALLKITTLEEDDKLYDLNLIRTNRNKSKAYDNNLAFLDAISSRGDYLKKTAEEFIKNDKISLWDWQVDDQTSIVKNAAELYNFYNKLLSNSDNKSGLEFYYDLDKIEKDYVAHLKALNKKAYSVTDLEKYAECPYKYFSDKIYNFKEDEEESLVFTKLEKGNFFHRIFYNFYSYLQNLQNNENNQQQPVYSPVKLIPAEYNSYKNILKDIAEKEIELLNYDHPFFNVQSAEIFGDEYRKEGLLDIWLKNEMDFQRENPEILPVLFELPFGRTSIFHFNALGPVNLKDKLLLKGKADRIEIINKDGQNYLIIADYKSKKASNTISGIENGKAYQMSLYMLAVQKILKDVYNIETEPGQAVYYFYTPEKNGDDIKYRELIYSSPDITENNKKAIHDINEFLSENLENAENIVNSISNGRISVTPGTRACQYCNYKPLCRINYIKNLKTSG